MQKPGRRIARTLMDAWPLSEITTCETIRTRGKPLNYIKNLASCREATNKTLMDSQKKIACLGWGSLIWKLGTLPYLGGWNPDGPMLPVEFARESADSRITLVICNNVREVQTLWTLLDTNDISTARQQLGQREYDAAKSTWIEGNIGFWDKPSGTSHGESAAAIATWAEANDFAGVVWTNLRCGLKASRGLMPSGVDVVEHLRGLHGEARSNAEEYIRKTPHQVNTVYRELIAAELGWI